MPSDKSQDAMHSTSLPHRRRRASHWYGKIQQQVKEHRQLLRPLQLFPHRKLPPFDMTHVILTIAQKNKRKSQSCFQCYNTKTRESFRACSTWPTYGDGRIVRSESPPPLNPHTDRAHSFIGKTGGEIFHEMMLRQGVKHICECSLGFN